MLMTSEWCLDSPVKRLWPPTHKQLIENGSLRPQPLATIEDVEQTGESGLMDLSLHPQFAQNHFIYLAYAYRSDGQRVRVVRFREAGNSLADRRGIIENIPGAVSGAPWLTCYARSPEATHVPYQY